MTRRNPNEKRCAREGCRAWAMRGSELCNVHSGRAGGGAPKGNRNRWKHGYYARPEALGFDENAGKGRTIHERIALLAARRPPSIVHRPSSIRPQPPIPTPSNRRYWLMYRL